MSLSLFYKSDDLSACCGFSVQEKKNVTDLFPNGYFTLELKLTCCVQFETVYVSRMR